MVKNAKRTALPSLPSLLTCATNIGWTIAFPKASAIVTAISTPLSHAAIGAREFDIPAVVGSGNATTVIRSGDRILVDGAAGSVKVLTPLTSDNLLQE